MSITDARVRGWLGSGRVLRLRRPAVAILRPAVAAALLVVVTLGPISGSASATDTAGIDAYVRGAMESSGIPGISYALVRDGEVVHIAAFGAADGTGRPMTPQTPVVIGSTGKTITALAIRQLVESGAIDEDAPIARYLPWFALATPGAGDAITIRQLLEHRSGLSTADGQDPAYYEPDRTPEEVVRGLVDIRLDRAPGTFEYSNLNYVILGVIVEAASRQPYETYVQAHVFDPLGMTHSYASLAAAEKAGIAQGHRYLFGFPVAFDEPYPTGMVPAGYQVSTAEDMAHFVAAFSNRGQYGSVDIVGAGSQDADYGIDWRPITVATPGFTPSHSGSTISSNTALMYTPSARVGVVVLANANPTQFMNVPLGASDIALGILRLDSGGAPDPGPPTVRTVYLIVDAALLLLVACAVFEATRIRSWRRAMAERRRRLVLVRTALADGVLPLLILLGLPLWIGASGSTAAGDPIAGWQFLAWTLPDLAFVLLGAAACLLVSGIAKAVILRGTTMATVEPAPGR